MTQDNVEVTPDEQGWNGPERSRYHHAELTRAKNAFRETDGDSEDPNSYAAYVAGLREEIDRLSSQQAAPEVVEAADSKRLDWLQSESADVRWHDDSDDGVILEIVGHWQAPPHDRLLAINGHEDLRGAIDEAMTGQVLEQPPIASLNTALSQQTKPSDDVVDSGRFITLWRKTGEQCLDWDFHISENVSELREVDGNLSKQKVLQRTTYRLGAQVTAIADVLASLPTPTETGDPRYGKVHTDGSRSGGQPPTTPTEAPSAATQRMAKTLGVGWKHDPKWTPTTPPVDDDAVERAGRTIFEHWDFGVEQPGQKPAWVPNGNSVMQQRARAFARAALSASDDTVKLLRELVEAVEALPVEDMVDADRDGSPILVGYQMQAQGEWDTARRAAEAGRTALSNTGEG